LDRTREITISDVKHRPANDWRYRYASTFLLRGLTELHVEFAPVAQ
jgi:hypothetical protein